MKNPLLPLLLLASIPAMLAPRDSRALSLEAFRGTYNRGGTMKITDGGAASGEGTAQLFFRIGSHKANGRLNITGKLIQGDTERPVAVSYLFKINRVAAISNLAPGIDDGRNAKGTFRAGRRRITARVPFALGTVSGMATLSLRLRARPHGATLEVVQTLSTTAISRPIVWKFKAATVR
jgi:hypothetical protein